MDSNQKFIISTSISRAHAIQMIFGLALTEQKTLSRNFEDPSKTFMITNGDIIHCVSKDLWLCFFFPWLYSVVQKQTFANRNFDSTLKYAYHGPKTQSAPLGKWMAWFLNMNTS